MTGKRTKKETKPMHNRNRIDGENELKKHAKRETRTVYTIRVYIDGWFISDRNR